MDEPGCRQRVTLWECREPALGEPTPAIPPRQPFLPDRRDLTGIPAYSSRVARYAVVGIVAPHHRGQMGVLVRMDRCRLTRHQAVTAASARAKRFFAVTCRTTFLPARDLPHTWVKPRKVNEVPSVSGWLVPSGRLLRKSTKRVLSGWSVSPYRASRLPRTPRTRLASRKSSNAITASSAKRTRVHLPLRRGRTSISNHSSSTWCRKIFERQGEITPPCGEPSVAWCKRPSSRTPAFSHLSIIRRMTPSVTRRSRKSRRWECGIESKYFSMSISSTHRCL